MQTVTTFLWFDNQAEEAAKFYTSLFENGRIKHVSRYGSAGPAPAGTVMTVEFELSGQRFTALNAGPHFKFNEAISIHVEVETQEEIDRLWKALTAGGEESQCGWLKDRYGLSWQIDPRFLREALSQPGERADRVMTAMMKMGKIDLAELKRAAG